MGRFRNRLISGRWRAIRWLFRSTFELGLKRTIMLRHLRSVNELRWGLFEDTDNELGMTAPYGDWLVHQRATWCDRHVGPR